MSLLRMGGLPLCRRYWIIYEWTGIG